MESIDSAAQINTDTARTTSASPPGLVHQPDGASSSTPSEYSGNGTPTKITSYEWKILVQVRLTLDEFVPKPSPSSVQPNAGNGSPSTTANSPKDHEDHPSLEDEDKTHSQSKDKALHHAIYLRLTAHEKTQLENEIFQWGYRGGGREEAQELSQNPTPLVEAITLRLFSRWSFAHDVRIALGSSSTLNTTEEDDDGAALHLFRELLDKRSQSPLQQVPGDSRRQRVDALVTDEINKDSFEKFVKALRDEGGGGYSSMGKPFVVAPCPEELPIWRLLAYQAWRNSKAWRCWPGVHQAACVAGDDWEVDYPYFETWDPARMEVDSDSDRWSADEDEDEGNDDADRISDSGSKKNLSRDPKGDDGPHDEKTTLPTAIDHTDGDSETVPSISSSLRSKRWRLREELDAEFDAADVWDVWILCQMVRCQEAIWSFDQNPGTEHRFYLFEQLPVFKETWERREIGPKYEECGYLQRALPDAEDSDGSEEGDEKSFTTLRKQWPLPLPRDCIEFADYHEYRFYEIDDEEVISSLLASAGLLDNPETVGCQDSLNRIPNAVPVIEWDLVYLDHTRRDPLCHDSGREHLHHTLYTSDDYIQWQYDKGVDHPGLCHPCDCIKLSPDQLEERNKQDEKEHQKILDEGEQWTKHETEGAPKRGPPDPKFYAWKSREKRARLKIEMREKHGRWREYPEEHYDYGHAGGNVVFNRRRVEDVPEFVKGLDRFWVDWNDCMLIMGGREDEQGDPTDEDTIYVFETLPGIKSRRYKIKQA